MSLVNCPECGHDVSAAAIACPNCGRPLKPNAVPVVRPAVVHETDRVTGFPTWGYIAIAAALALITLFIFGLVTRDSAEDEANTNIRVRTEAERASRPTRDATYPADADTTYTVPPSTIDPPPSETTVPAIGGANPRPSTGTVKISAKVIAQNGKTEAVSNEKFFLLEKDLEQVLRDARVEPIEGNTLSGSLALAMASPGTYDSFYRQAMAAINRYVEYSGTTDSKGMTELTGVEPGSYYLFGVTRTDEGYAIWSAPVSVVAGDNVLNLAPQRINQSRRMSN